ncbi:hypothetical protein [Kitasatospora purpeofusca]|uniref:hypothetical protein n=1 Tax=Kitasatospora purpeofusca TaxID=67352 RepID=UPI002A5A029A|nr:hypothetical protein [Kitasatospora purpeofusca]MDY0810773.1 hypothetical protein [Kitasatospora purpeofusca]
MTANIPRRSVLRRAIGIAAGAAVGSQVLATPGHAAAAPAPGPDLGALRKLTQDAREREARVRTGAASGNGWEMEKVVNDRGNIYTRPVPGTPLGINVRMGNVETVLVHVISRFHYEVAALHEGDVVSWRPPASVRRHLAESNQASGTAVQIRPASYPTGARGGFYPLEELTLRDILADCEGVVRWGGDDKVPDESLFYIDVPPGDRRLTSISGKLRGWAFTPGQGAGTMIDPLQPERLRAAKRLAGQQA